jgi:hypothetical protein
MTHVVLISIHNDNYHNYFFPPFRLKTVGMSDFSAFATKYVLLVFGLLNAKLIPSCKFQLTELLCKGI